MSGYVGESIPPAGRSVGDSRPVGSTPTSRVHIAARRPVVDYSSDSGSSLSLLARATAARSLPGAVGKSIPPAGRWVGDSRPFGSPPPSRESPPDLPAGGM